jgi:hypothetical protein
MDRRSSPASRETSNSYHYKAMNLILLVIACNAVPLLAWWALSKFGPWVLVGICAWALGAWIVLTVFRALGRINSNNKLT